MNNSNARPYKIATALLAVCLAAVVAVLAMTHRPPPGAAAGDAGPDPPAQYAPTPPPTQRSQPAPIQPAYAPPTQQQPTNAAQVLQYLGQLKQIETQKELIFTRQLAVAQTQEQQAQRDSEAGYPPNNDTLRSSEQLVSEMEGIYTQVSSLSVPAACSDLQRCYLQHIGSARRLFADSASVLTKISTDPQMAIAEQRTIKNNQLPRAHADTQSADNALSSLCTRFQIPKDFRISEGG